MRYGIACPVERCACSSLDGKYAVCGRRERAAARGRRTRGGGTKVPPASCESPPLPSGRAARAKVSLAFAVPPGCLDRASRTDATPGAGARCAPLRKGYGGAPVGWNPPFLLLMAAGRQGEGVTHFARAARPYLRQQMQKIFLLFARRFAPGEKGEGVIHKRGGTLVPPLLCACGA